MPIDCNAVYPHIIAKYRCCIAVEVGTGLKTRTTCSHCVRLLRQSMRIDRIGMDDDFKTRSASSHASLAVAGNRICVRSVISMRAAMPEARSDECTSVLKIGTVSTKVVRLLVGDRRPSICK